MIPLLKYPRTQHLESSRLQPGDEDLSAVQFSQITGRTIVAEEKIDGANAAVSFDDDGSLLLQSRGHYLTGGPREKHFAMMKTWASAHQAALRSVLGCRYLMFGEWAFARHTVFYDRLPHLFLEFDVWDREAGEFLSTPRRRELLAPLPVASVPVLYAGPARSLDHLWSLVGAPLWQSAGWAERLEELARQRGLDVNRVIAESDTTSEAEGLYLKVEEGGQVTQRLKLVRPSFLQTVMQSGTHWLARPTVPNQLNPRADLFDPTRKLLAIQKPDVDLERGTPWSSD